MRFARTLLAGGALAAASVLATAGIADACGAFFPRKTTENVPSLSAEQVLIIHDAAKGMEHFVREVAFQDGDQSFGFVVPTPARPDVGAVKKRPFKELEQQYPMHIDPPGGGRGEGIGLGSKGGIGHGAGVTVLEVKQVGSFRAFVLAASDAAGLRAWLDENQFTTTKESEAWLDVYVKQSFFFVAMRHDPPAAPAKKKRRAMTAETIRISFATPFPYYPYREPNHDTAPATTDRMVALWLVTDGDPRMPVALRERDGNRELVRPFREGEHVFTPEPASIAAAVGEELRGLLPVARSATLTVQVFEDQKISRKGLGDVLFVAKSPTPKPIPDLDRWVAVLDPSGRGAL